MRDADPNGRRRGLTSPARPRYRHFDQEPATERMPHYDAAMRVAGLLLAGYGLTLLDVKRATGCSSLDTAHKLLQAATRQFAVVVVPYDREGPRGPGQPMLVWYIDPDLSLSDLSPARSPSPSPSPVPRPPLSRH